ncbi:MAG: DUF4384 domain-containing protein [Candidatus Melainabacteria bacterium]|nr:DUF4384 domain-containing protein [Candidatus Melainabacteria bacterium]
MISNSLVGWVSLVIISSLCVQLAYAQGQGAKGLYLEQMNEPTRNINTGIQYWIELNRDSTLLQVNNKFTFRSGDKIRFHIKANIDGYAYIVLKSGSRGEQSILFPEPGEANQVSRGRDYALPQDGYLTFDQNPGLEKVALLVSRTPVEVNAYLNQPVHAERAIIASAQTGAKDLIPSKILLSYTPVLPQKVVKPATPQMKNSRQKPQQKQSTGKSRSRIRRMGRQSVQEPVVQEENQVPDATDEGVVTVVFKDPAGVLSLEVDLQHI